MKHGLILIFMLIWMSCQTTTKKEGERMLVVVTTPLLKDVVEAITDDLVEVRSLMAPGTDPHTYKPASNDIRWIRSADVIVMHGFNMETKLGEVLKNGDIDAQVIDLSTFLPKSQIRFLEGVSIPVTDPHVWMSIPRWIRQLDSLTVRLSVLAPAHAETFQIRWKTYQELLQSLDSEFRNAMASIPPGKRWIISQHDGLGYWADTYGFESDALQGISTAGDIGVKDIQRVVQLIEQHGIDVVFYEYGINRQPMESLVEGMREKGIHIQLAGPLFIDGPGGAEVSTYIEMMRWNHSIILQSLGAFYEQ